MVIFGTIDAPKIKMVFCLESVRQKQKCDLLLPIIEDNPPPTLVSPEQARHSAQA